MYTKLIKNHHFFTFLLGQITIYCIIQHEMMVIGQEYAAKPHGREYLLPGINMW